LPRSDRRSVSIASPAAISSVRSSLGIDRRAGFDLNRCPYWIIFRIACVRWRRAYFAAELEQRLSPPSIRRCALMS